MNAKEKELIAVTVSVAAGCEPCTQHHVKAAREVGGDDGELRQMIETALSIRERASQRIGAIAWRELGAAAEFPRCGSGTPAQKLGALASAAAALAANCGAGVPGFLAVARGAGATGQDEAVALVIARQIKNVAAEKAEDAAREESEASAPCGCATVAADRESSSACC